jgi:tRNA-dihydrouridine synthase
MLILAPMQGLTELMFRKVYHTCFPGALDLAISPFLSLTHGNLADAWIKIDDVLPEANQDSIPVIPQILGKEPIEFVELANRLHEIGYSEVNWNIGCPMRRVTAKHRGSGILPYPDEVRSILDYIMPRLRPALSVKMRLGLHSPDEIFNLIPILNDYPLLNITIHPRTGKQQYSGQVDLDTFEQTLPLLKHQVIYNGDLCTVADFRRLRQRFPKIQHYMIGRGILYDPLLPLKIKNNHPADLKATLLFVTALSDAINQLPIREESRMRKTKEYWCLVRRSLPITEQQATAVLRAQTPSETNTKLRAILASI